MASTFSGQQVALGNVPIANGTKANAENIDILGPNDEGDAKAWVVIGAASAVLFVGVGYTNAYGVLYV
jgi:hypothetical protein